jgi:hypothetical protein
MANVAIPIIEQVMGWYNTTTASGTASTGDATTTGGSSTTGVLGTTTDANATDTTDNSDESTSTIIGASSLWASLMIVLLWM